MKFLFPFILLAISIAFFFFNMMEMEPKSLEEKTEKVLFIGNSYTYRNKGVGRHMADLIGGGQKPEGFIIKRAAKGKFHLSVHLDYPETMDFLRSEMWDKIVLQEYSSGPIQKPQEFFSSGKKWAKKIRKRNPNCKIYLFATWEYNGVDGMAEALNNQYLKLGKMIKAEVIPVGMMWHELQDKINLYDADNAHPNRKGTFASACLFYECFYNKDVTKTPNTDKFLSEQEQNSIKRWVHDFQKSRTRQYFSK
jgi:hypothetical protein